MLTIDPSDSPMTETEIQRLQELEAVVVENWQMLGKSLKEIRDSKLYRQTSEGERRTWEEYCKRSLGLSKQYVDKVIRAAEVVEVLQTETTVSELPKTVSQAAHLSGLEPAQMEAVCQKACLSAKSEGRKATAKDYEEAIESMNDTSSLDSHTTNGAERSSHPEKAEIDSDHITTPEESQPEISSPTTKPSNRKPGRTHSIGIHVENDELAELLKERLRTSRAATTLGEPKGHFVSGFTSRDQIANYLKAIQRLLKEGKQMDIQITIK